MYRRMIALLSMTLLYLAFAHASATNTNDTQCYSVNTSQTHIVSSLRIMQYNVEWLFLKTYNNCPGSGCSWANLADATTHLQNVAAVIRKYNPDIVNLCEVEGCYELGQLNTLLGNVYTPYLLFGTDTSTGQNVGILTKYSPRVSLQRSSMTRYYPVAGSGCNYTGPPGSSSVSKHYYTEYKINDMTVYFIGAHLLAMPTEPSRCVSREAQAEVLQQLIVGLLGGIDPSTRHVVDNDHVGLIIAGDMNDYDGEILDANNNRPISIVLDILKGNAGEYALAYELYSAAADVDQRERYTDWWDPNGDCESTANEMSMIDHVLMTPNLVGKLKQVTMPHPYKEFCGTYNSDHFPIILDFEF